MKLAPVILATLSITVFGAERAPSLPIKVQAIAKEMSKQTPSVDKIAEILGGAARIVTPKEWMVETADLEARISMPLRVEIYPQGGSIVKLGDLAAIFGPGKLTRKSKTVSVRFMSDNVPIVAEALFADPTSTVQIIKILTPADNSK